MERDHGNAESRLLALMRTDFRLSLGGIQYRFDCGPLHMGWRGPAMTGLLTAFCNDKRVALGSIERMALSEALRAVDLIVSVSAFALEPFHIPRFGPGSRAAVARVEVLTRLFGTTPRDAPWIDGHNVRVGDTRIHVATGQAWRNDLPCPVPPASSQVIDLPYPDPVLERIVRQANAAMAGV